MVDQKKHDKLLKVGQSGTDNIFADTGAAKIIIPVAEQKGIYYIKLPENSKHTRGDQYVFEYNKEDVMRFCMQSKNLARLVMADIYTKYLK